MLAVGVDLAGVPTRPTGMCALDQQLRAKTRLLYRDDEICEYVDALRPGVVAVDAPLALPLGRRSLEEAKPPHLRACDRELLRMGIRFFPVTLGPMRQLTARGMSLRATMEAAGYGVIEVYPGAAQDLWGLPRKQEGVEKLQRALARRGIDGALRRRGLSHHELDAVTAALVGIHYLQGRYRAIGDPREVQMILPA